MKKKPRTELLPASLLALCGPLAMAQAPQASDPSGGDTRPNILLFIVDDMGWQDTSHPLWTDTTELNRRYHTPNMERMASQGMSFPAAYASSVSSPSRVSLMTGMNPARHRVTNWTLHRDKQTDSESQVIALPKWNVNGLSPVDGIARSVYATALPELLRKAGYHTIHCGKAHFGANDTPGADPKTIGFDVNIAGHAAGGPLSYQGTQRFGHDKEGKPKSPFAIPGLEKYWDKDIFLTEALTQEAIQALERAEADKPFFLYMAHYAIHIPLDRDSRYFQKYRDRGLSDNEAAYAALIEGMDKSLGDLMDYLQRTGKDKNTLILFISDNGGLSATPYWRDQPLHQHNAPLNSGKGSAYEGGVRVPMLARWDGVVAPSTRQEQYVSIEDFLPTLLEVAGASDQQMVQTVDGKSFLPLLKGKKLRRGNKRNLYWNFPNQWGPTGPGIGATCSMRQGDWKLIYYYETGKKELFNLRQDIGETQDLAERNPKLVRKLSKELGSYLREVEAQRPNFKATGKPCPWPDEV